MGNLRLLVGHYCKTLIHNLYINLQLRHLWVLPSYIQRQLLDHLFVSCSVSEPSAFLNILVNKGVVSASMLDDLLKKCLYFICPCLWTQLNIYTMYYTVILIILFGTNCHNRVVVMCNALEENIHWKLNWYYNHAEQLLKSNKCKITKSNLRHLSLQVFPPSFSLFKKFTLIFGGKSHIHDGNIQVLL